MKTEKDLFMYFQTALRNVGLYTSISFASLGYSRYYRDKNSIYNLYLILVSLVFLLVSLFVCHNLLKDVKHFQEDVKSEQINKGLVLPQSILYFNIGVFLLGMYTFYREIKK